MLTYSERQAVAFSQIAYMDMDTRFQYYKAAGIEKAPLSEILYPSEYEQLIKMGITDHEIQSWSISAVRDTNAENGFYACVIDTGDGNAAVAFRGSDGRNGMDQYFHDWYVSDAGLLNSTLTVEQKQVDVFLQENQELLQSYVKLMPVGHSLGGNLSEYCTIVSEKYGLDNQIDSCVSLDGPGFSNEFKEAHREQIEKMTRKTDMYHPRWSIVGSLLYDLSPNVKYEYVQVSNEANHLDNEQYTEITRHDTKYVAFDDQDHFIQEENPDGIARTAGTITRWLDYFIRMDHPVKDVSTMGPGYTILPLIARIFAVPLLRAVSKGAALYSNRYKSAAHKEAGEHTEFYIDTVQYSCLGDTALQSADHLAETARALQAKHVKPSFSLPDLPGNIQNIPYLQLTTHEINMLLGWLDGMLNTNSICVRLLLECSETIKSAGEYLRSAAQEFTTVENLAVKISSSWNQ